MNTLLRTESPPRVALAILLEMLGNTLANWLHGKLLRHGGSNWWQKHIADVLPERDQERIAAGEWKQLQDLDLDALLRVLIINYRFLKARRALDAQHREVIWQMRQTRHRCVGHPPVNGIPSDEINTHLETLKSFAKIISAGEDILSKLNELEDLLSKADLHETAPESGQTHEVERPGTSHGPKLSEFFAGKELTPSQSTALNELQAFLNDRNRQCFILRGYAGTGKTFIIGGLVRYLNAIKRSPRIMAPTGRAAHVISERNQVEAHTIHRSIYSLENLKEYREVDEDGDITFKFYYQTKNNDIDHDTVFIVDEASMVSDNYTEAEFMHFGSGRLLSDLFKYVNFDSNDYNKKIIFVGDNAQLPPVGMNKSPALDSKYLSNRFRVKVDECELTDVVRQSSSNLILKNATKLRNMLSEMNFSEFEFETDDNSVVKHGIEDFIKIFLDGFKVSLPVKSVIIAYTNAKTKAYNDSIRDRLFPEIKKITKGDQIIVIKNNFIYEHALMNGQMGLVVKAEDENEERVVTLKRASETKDKPNVTSITLCFRSVVLQFLDHMGQPYDLKCKILEQALYSQEANISSDDSKALYVDFRIRNPKLRPHMPEFKEALRADPYFNAVILKFGYAITCHKSQGGEWNTVFVDFDGQNKLNVEAIRWSYTALTRAAKRVVATNALHHSMLKPLKRVNAIPSLERTPIDATAVSTSEGIFQIVANLLPDGWKITPTRSLNYQEKYKLEHDGSVLGLSIYYNAKNIVSKFQVVRQIASLEIADLVAKRLSSLQNKFIGNSLAEEQQSLPQHADFVKEFKSRLEEMELVRVDSKTTYHLLLVLRFQREECCVNCYFNKARMFTNYDAADTISAGFLKNPKTL